MKIFHTTIFLCFVLQLTAQFAPPAGEPGTTAIHADSSIFVNWANDCVLDRGWLNIADTLIGHPDFGDEGSAIGKSGENGTVSLGDAGSATLTFEYPIYNGPGWDFAVFENAFLPDFLELAFVEVSSDGIHFTRFPATSLSDTSIQTMSFGQTDARKVNNLAGKYEQSYGTPFDLAELNDTPNLDVNRITHVRIIDVVGSLDNRYCPFDKNGRKINDPFPTPFPSGGFDLDAVGVIHELNPANVSHSSLESSIRIYPNPIRRGENLSVLYEGEKQLFIKDAGSLQPLRTTQFIETTSLESFDYLSFYNAQGVLLYVEKIIVLP